MTCAAKVEAGTNEPDIINEELEENKNDHGRLYRDRQCSAIESAVPDQSSIWSTRVKCALLSRSHASPKMSSS
jgi:hypothetical protein